MTVRRAEEQVARDLSLAVGLAGVAYACLNAPEILHQARYAPTWWTPAAVAVFLGPCALLAALARGAPPARLRAAAGLVAVGYLFAAGSMPLVVASGEVVAQASWPYRYANLGIVASVLAWRRTAAYGYLIGCAALAAAINGYVLGHPGWSWYAGDFARAVTMSAVLAVCCLSAQRMAADLDRETVLAAQRAAAVAAAEAEDRERARFAALVHDGVMATLLEASRTDRTDTLARQARNTLRQLDQFHSPAADSEADRVDATAVLGLLRTTVHEVGAEIGFASRRRPGSDQLRVPAEVAHTTAAALAEAIRNSIRHADVAGRTVNREVTVTIGPGDIRVVVADDGAGFDPAAVSPRRLGVALSIRDRMARLPGGAAAISARPGEGTIVELQWSDDVGR